MWELPNPLLHGRVAIGLIAAGAVLAACGQGASGPAPLTQPVLGAGDTAAGPAEPALPRPVKTAAVKAPAREQAVPAAGTRRAPTMPGASTAEPVQSQVGVATQPRATPPFQRSFGPGPLGEFHYAQTGTTPTGAAAPQMTLTISPDPGDPAGQRWTFDGRSAEGYGAFEQYTVVRRGEAVLAKSIRFEQAGEFGSLVLEFVPGRPVKLVPAKLDAGLEWGFDLVSTNGCALVRTTVLALAPAGTRPSGKVGRLRFVSTLRTTDKLGCLQISAERTQEFHFGATPLPARVDTEISGSVAGLPISARTTAIRSTKD